MKALFKSINLIGDALYVGPALSAWIKQQKEPVDIWFQTLDDHVAPLYEGMVRDLWLPGEHHVHTFGTVFNRPREIKFDFEHTFDVNAAFKLSDAKKQHLAKSYADLLGVEIGNEKSDLKPIYIPEIEWIEEYMKGCILISMFSASCTGRDPKCNYIPNKMLPFEKWIPMIEFLRSKFPGTLIRFLGAPTDLLPPEWDRKITADTNEYMLGIPLNRLALIMRSAKLLVTIDNGMSHLGASQEVPTFLMYPKALGLHYIMPIGNPNLVFVHMNPVNVSPDHLLHGLKFAVDKFENTAWKEKK